jgi:hypothetical protein
LFGFYDVFCSFKQQGDYVTTAYNHGTIETESTVAVNSVHVDPSFWDVDPPRFSGIDPAQQAISVRA